MATKKKSVKKTAAALLNAVAALPPPNVDPGLLYNPEFGKPGEGLNDFRNFLTLVWAFLGLPAPTPAQYDLAYYLQYGPKRCILMAFRGIGKSYITAAFVCWVWLMNPQLKQLVVSASEKKATEFATLVKQLIDGMPGLEHLKAKGIQRDSVLSFDVGPATPAKDPSLNVAGITGMITGGRADIIIADDVESPDNSQTVTMREKIENKVTEFDAILKPEPWSRIIYLGTPQTEQSLYLALSAKGYVIRVWPARFPVDIAKYKGRLAPWIVRQQSENASLVGKPTDPRRFSELDLKERELSLGPTGFQMQYMLDPSLSDENLYPLKLKDFVVMHVNRDKAPAQIMWAADPRWMINDPDFPVVGLNGDRYYSPGYVSELWEDYEHKQMAIDPAGAGAAETAYIIQNFLKGMCHIAEWSGMQAGQSDSAMIQVANIALEHGVEVIHVEDNFGDGAYARILQPILTRIWEEICDKIRAEATQQNKVLKLPRLPGINLVHSKGVKELRICDTVEPVLAGHRLVLSPDVIKKDFRVEHKEYQALYQVTRINRRKGALKVYDRADVLAIGLQGAAEFFGRDIQNAEEQARELKREQALRRWVDWATEGRAQGNSERGTVFQNMDEGPGIGLDGESQSSPSPFWMPQ